WTHHDVGSIGTRLSCRSIDVGYKVARPLHAKWIRYRCLKSEDRQRAYRSEHELRHCAARGGGDRENPLFGGRPSEGGDQARDEAVEIFRGHVNVCRIVLRTHGHILVRRGGKDRRTEAEHAQQNRNRSKSVDAHYFFLSRTTL